MCGVLTMNVGGIYGVTRSCCCNWLYGNPRDKERCTTVASVPWNLYTLYVPAFIIPLSSGRENRKAGQGGEGRGSAYLPTLTMGHFLFIFLFLRG